MRKFTLLLAMVALVSFAFGQKGFVPVAHQKTKAEVVKAAVQAENPQKTKAPGDVIWEHDFNGDLWSGTSVEGNAMPNAAPEGWELRDYTGNGYHWRWSLEGPRGMYTSEGSGTDPDYCNKPLDFLLSETAYNGFMMLEIDHFNSSSDCQVDSDVPLDAAVIYTEGIDFSGKTSVHLMFTQWSRFCCSPYGDAVDAWFETSTDGGVSWEKLKASVGAVNVGAPNGEITELDITNMVADNENVQFRFRLQGFFAYHWEIDDVKFIEPVSYDMTITDYWNDYIDLYEGYEEEEPGVYQDENDFVEGYYQYPWFMVQPFKRYSASYLNYGYESVTNYKHGVQIRKNGETIHTFEGDVIAEVVPAAVDTVKTLGNFEPYAKGYYEILHYSVFDETDQRQENDTISRPFVVTDSMLAPVNHRSPDSRVTPSGWQNYVPQRGLGFTFELPETDLHGTNAEDFFEVNGVEVYLPTQGTTANELISSGGAKLKAQLFRYNETTEKYDLIIDTDVRDLTMNDTATFIYLRFNKDGSQEMLNTAGEYLVNVIPIGTFQLYGREQTFSIGANSDRKESIGASLLVAPNAETVGRIQRGLCMALSMSFTDTYPTEERTIEFTITDGTNPVDNARIVLGSHDVRTDENGVVAISIEDGTYPLTITAKGFADYSDVVTVSADDNISIPLNPVRTIKVIVKDDIDQILALASVTIDGEEEKTNEDGEAEFDLLYGNYDISVVRLGHEDYTGTVEVSASGEAAFNIFLNRSEFTVPFTVTDGTNAIEGATIAINGVELTTNAEGYAESNLMFGVVEFTASKENYLTYSGSVTVQEGAEANIVLKPIYEVKFVVVDTDNAPLADATITINEVVLTSDANGEAVIELPMGDYPYTATKEGYNVVSSSLSVVDAAITENVTLAPSYAVAFTVVDKDDSPIANATITVNGEEYTTSVVGQKVILLPDGMTHTFTVSATGYELYTDSVEVNGAATSVTAVLALESISDVFATFSVYPNPSNGTFKVSVEGMANMTVLDIAGQVVESRTINGTETINLDVESGVYFVRVQNGNEIATKQVVIR